MVIYVRFRTYDEHMRIINILSAYVAFAVLSISLLSGTAIANEYLYVTKPQRLGILQDGKMHIFMVGTGNPEFEMENVRKPACLAIICNGEFVLIDAGEGAIQNIAAFGLPYHALEKVFMTHWHSDHFAGLGQVINASWIRGRKNPVTVYGPFGVNKIVSAINSAYELDAIYRSATVDGAMDPALTTAIPVELRSTDDLFLVYAGKNFEVASFRVNHTPVVPALGYVIKYGGKKIVISGDTRVAPNLERHAANADILINEAFSRPLSEEVIAISEKAGDKFSAGFTKDISKYHSDSIDLAKMADRAKVKRLVLTHLVPVIPTLKKVEDDFVAGMNQDFKNELIVAADGDEIVIDNNDANKPVQFIRQAQPKIPFAPAAH
jgi:ribonuclease Z